MLDMVNPNRTQSARARRSVPATMAMLMVMSGAGAAEARAALHSMEGLDTAARLIYAGIAAELLMPDVSYEWGPDADGNPFVLTWPVPLSLLAVDVTDRLAVALEARGELQWHWVDGVRWAATARVPVFLKTPRRWKSGQLTRHRIRTFYWRPGLYAEAGGLTGAGGPGTVLGGGLLLGGPSVALGAGYRALDLRDAGRRHAVGVDLHLALPVWRWVRKWMRGR